MTKFHPLLAVAGVNMVIRDTVAKWFGPLQCVSRFFRVRVAWRNPAAHVGQVLVGSSQRALLSSPPVEVFGDGRRVEQQS